ncbi:response regulator transcription factor [Motiliproteus sp. MSK22-1]|uniref:response regulator n=1 Tax=Motiliproteus sp. MSK22-1 TaxID=1897630 RepID=UPI0009759AD2|nr:response regulator transcription factor [Motiliproteus sp. MSK22-1]OMH28022.1 DNA-binding response regulator [Motiliproteus sp. MSK22-1]
MRVLLIEDDQLLGQGIQINLQQRGYRVDWCQDGQQGLHGVIDLQPDLVILDLNLPSLDGIGLLKKARHKGASMPVLILTARDAIEHRITGLDSGADDYLIKPFDMDELDARLRALHRRAHGRSDEILNVGEIEIRTGAREVFFQQQPVSLGRREYELLLLLLDNRGRVLTRRQLEEKIYEDDPESNALEVHVHNLRKKLGKSLITTVRGVGYLMGD